MAVTLFEGGFSMAAVADAPSLATPFVITSIVIVKTTAGTVTLKDGAGVVCLLTGTLADGSTTPIPLGGQQVKGIEYDAVSAGSAVVYVYGHSK